MPSLGLGYLASVLRKDKNEVWILNCLKEKMTYKTFENFIHSEHFDIYGLQMFSYDWDSIRKHLEIIKASNPSAITVVGGPHPSGDPTGTLKSLHNADFAFQGEAEIGLRKFIQQLNDNHSQDWSDISGLVWRGEDNKIFANPVEVVSDLDSLGFPAWDLQRPTEFPRAPHGAFAKNFPTAPMIITRGCPFQCTFCAGKSISGNKLRKRSIDHVLEEINYLTGKFNVKEIHLEDECFTVHKSLVMEFCEKLLAHNVGISWGLPSGIRLDTLDREMLKQMARAGCYSVSIGIEFGSQRVLDLAKKKLTLEMIREKIALLNETDIKTTGFFLLGLPGETKEDIQATIDFSLELNLDRVQYNNFMPLPGSELWDELQNRGLLKNINLNKLFVHDVAYVPKGMKASSLKWFQRKAYLMFYLRPTTIIRLLREITSLEHLKCLLSRFLDAMK